MPCSPVERVLLFTCLRSTFFVFFSLLSDGLFDVFLPIAGRATYAPLRLPALFFPDLGSRGCSLIPCPSTCANLFSL